MEDLKELVAVINRHKIKQLDVITADSEPNNKFNELYGLIASGAINSDEDALDLLYEGRSSSLSSLYKLKSRLKTRLFNTVLFIDINQPQFTDIEKAYYNCNKSWLSALALISRGAKLSSISLLESTIKEAMKYDFTEIKIVCAKHLAWHYSVVEGNNSKFEYYQDIITQSLSDLVAENKAEEFYSKILLKYSKSQTVNQDPEDLNQIISYSEHLKSSYPSVQSMRFLRISYLVHIIRYQVAFDFHNAVAMCHEALSALKSKSARSSGVEFSFKFRLLTCLVQLRQFGEGAKLSQELSEMVQSGSFNWYLIRNYYFLLSTHTRNYALAYEIVIDAINQTDFRKASQSQQELWLVNRAYVNFLMRIGAISDSKPRIEFRLYKFLNEIPLYSKDKRGINISILILHVLYLLDERKHAEIIDRVDALNQYCHRYLRRDDTFRANCFIKMLLQMARADFNRIRTERYAEKYKVKLHSEPLKLANRVIEVEIIPYEHLWEMVLELLD